MADDTSSFADHILDPTRKASEAMRATGEKVVESGSAISTRMIDQAEENARHAFAAMRAAAGAKDLSDVMQVQGDYLRDQGSRAMGQAREISEMILSFGRDAVSAAKGDRQA